MASENSILHANKNFITARRVAGWPHQPVCLKLSKGSFKYRPQHLFSEILKNMYLNSGIIFMRS